MSLLTGKYNSDRDECQPEGGFTKVGDKCIKCDSSFISSIPIEQDINVTDSDGNERTIKTASCKYYPTMNKLNNTNICYKNDIFGEGKGCLKVFSLDLTLDPTDGQDVDQSQRATVPKYQTQESQGETPQ